MLHQQMPSRIAWTTISRTIQSSVTTRHWTTQFPHRWWSPIEEWLIKGNCIPTKPKRMYVSMYICMKMFSAQYQPFCSSLNMISRYMYKAINIMFFNYWDAFHFHSKIYLLFLTHWGRLTHICIINLTIIGSDNDLLPGRCQAII